MMRRMERVASGTEIRWEIAKLLKMGVNEQLLVSLSSDEIRALLKSVIYLTERQAAREQAAKRSSPAVSQ